MPNAVERHMHVHTMFMLVYETLLEMAEAGRCQVQAGT